MSDGLELNRTEDSRPSTLALFFVLLGGMSLAMLFQALRIWHVRRQLRQPALLNVVPVEITAFDRKRNILSITYNDKIANDNTGRSAYTRMKEGEEPLIVGEANGKAVGLAVMHGNTALPVLLDDRLQRIELTDDERIANPRIPVGFRWIQRAKLPVVTEPAEVFPHPSAGNPTCCKNIAN